MNLDDAIKTRHSVRKFQKKEVPNLDEIIALAKRGPSAGGIRGYEVIITDLQIISYDAPLYLVICCDPDKYEKKYGERGRDLYAIQDATIFGTYLQLLLVSRGLSSVWVGAFHEGRIQKALQTPLRPIAIFAIGYEADERT